MPLVHPTASQFKTRFDRDFAFCAPEAQTNLEAVRDVDIANAFTQADANFNEALFQAQAQYQEAYLQLAAHFLCVNMVAASQGVGGSAQWLTNSKGIAGVTEGFEVPERIKRSPFLAMISKTSYGMTYLNLIQPLLVGNVAVVCGGQFLGGGVFLR